ncbi:MAG: DUF3592 domain-containing protein [Anaerolineae bacterium]|nr:DUF3592 domain-containing protein [Anaerolineae bacterium]
MNFLLVFGIGMVLLGLVYLIAALLDRRRKETVGSWPTVEGHILSTDVVHKEKTTEEWALATYTPVVRYTYSVAEKAYTSENVDFEPERSFPSLAEAEAVAQRYPAGCAVTVHYNPHGPQQAALEVKKPTGFNSELVSGLATAVLGVLVIVVYVIFQLQQPPAP